MTDGESVDARGAHGVQVGNHGTQHNYFTAPSSSVADLEALHAVTAAKRIRALPPEDAAALIAQLTVPTAVALLEELLPSDEQLVITILTNMNQSRARQLATGLTTVAAWVADPPRAAADVRTAYNGARSALGEEVGPLSRILAHHGFALTCSGGVVIWRPTTGAAPVTGKMQAFLPNQPGGRPFLGLPTGPESHGVQRFDYADLHRHPRSDEVITVDVTTRATWWAAGGAIGRATSARKGSAQRFEDAADPSREVAIYAHGLLPAVAVFEPILSLYRKLDGPTGWLGFPAGDGAGPGDGNAIQYFDGGVIVRRPSRSVVAVPMPIFTTAADAGFGAPTGPVQRIGDGEDKIQFFERGLVTVRGGRAEPWSPKSGYDDIR